MYYPRDAMRKHCLSWKLNFQWIGDNLERCYAHQKGRLIPSGKTASDKSEYLRYTKETSSMSAAFLWQLNRGTDPEKKENHGKAETMK